MNPAYDIAACGGNTECFAFTIDTRLTSTGATTGTSTVFAIPVSGRVGYTDNSYDWIIDWGDGSTTQTVSGTGSTSDAGVAHDYASTGGAGQYQITIRPNGAATDGWFNAFGFYNSSSGANASANKYKFRSIDTPFTDAMRSFGLSDRFSYIFHSARNGLGIPTGLFDNVQTASSTDMSYLFYGTFAYYAYNSTSATIPSGLFDSIDTSSAIDVSGMFGLTFYFYAYNSNVGIIPARLFDSIDTSNATSFTQMFDATFYFYSPYSTIGNIPEGLFDSIDTSNATSLTRMFMQTFRDYAVFSTTSSIPAHLFDAIDTSNIADLSYVFYETFREYARESTVAIIPAGLFDSIDTSSATNLASMFRGTFSVYAMASTASTIPAGLFDSIDTSNATNVSELFMNTFYDHAEYSTTATIPAGLFDSVDTSKATNMYRTFYCTFNIYAHDSTVGTIPAGILDSIDTSSATNLSDVFGATFAGFATRSAQFVVSGSVVSSLTQTFTFSYATKVGANGTPSGGPTVTAGDKVYPTYNATDRTITAPTDPQYANYDWYYTDGTSCSVANPTPDCGIQNSSTLASFPNSNEWTPTTSTEKGNVTFYSLNLTPTITAVTPSKVLTDQASQTITITGTNFTGATAVTVDDVYVGIISCQSFNVISDTEISCVLPTLHGAGTVGVYVTTPNGTNADNSLLETIDKYIGISAPNSLNLNVNPSSFSSDFNTVTVSTNNPNGYSLSLKASSSSLTNTAATSATIPTLTNSFTPTNPASSTQTSNLIGNSSFWAYRVTNQGSFGSTTTKETNTASTNYSWAAIPTTNQTIRTGTVTDNLTTNTPQSTDIWFGVSPTNYQASGQYQVVITYTVVGL